MLRIHFLFFPFLKVCGERERERERWTCHDLSIFFTPAYEIPSKFALTKYVLECASDVGCCMKPAKTIGDSQKNETFFVCAYLRVFCCGHTDKAGLFFTVGSTSP